MIDNRKASQAKAVLGRQSIKTWREEDRPREKMLAHGAESLSNAELLAVLIGSGTAKKSAVALMGEVMDHCAGKISLLSRLSIQELTTFGGIGPVKALILKAAAELGRRRCEEELANDLQPIRTAQDVYKCMYPACRDLSNECSWVLLLNAGGRLLRRVRLSQGGRTETVVDVRMVMKEAILGEAVSIILVHNHPSGNCKPSTADRQLTQSVKAAASTLNITLVDHVIVSDGGYFSFSEEGQL